MDEKRHVLPPFTRRERRARRVEPLARRAARPHARRRSRGGMRAPRCVPDEDTLSNFFINSKPNRETGDSHETSLSKFGTLGPVRSMAHGNPAKSCALPFRKSHLASNDGAKSGRAGCATRGVAGGARGVGGGAMSHVCVRSAPSRRVSLDPRASLRRARRVGVLQGRR